MNGEFFALLVLVFALAGTILWIRRCLRSLSGGSDNGHRGRQFTQPLLKSARDDWPGLFPPSAAEHGSVDHYHKRTGVCSRSFVPGSSAFDGIKQPGETPFGVGKRDLRQQTAFGEAQMALRLVWEHPSPESLAPDGRLNRRRRLRKKLQLLDNPAWRDLELKKAEELAFKIRVYYRKFGSWYGPVLHMSLEDVPEPVVFSRTVDILRDEGLNLQINGVHLKILSA